MAQDKAALVQEVLGELFSLASGQTPTTDDTAFVESRIDTTLAELAKRNVIYIPDPEAIEDEVFNALAAYMAQICGPKFGRARDFAAKQAAEDELRTIQRIGRGTGAMLTVDRAARVRRGRFSITGGV